MAFLINTLAFAVVICGLVFSAWLALETAASFARPRMRARSGNRPTNIAIVVPAHNEAGIIAKTLGSILAQCNQSDRVIVVADNCVDETADVARSCGVSVLERENANQRGKGFALQFALDHLKTSPPDVVIFIDADCTIYEGAVETLGDLATTNDRPAQAMYLLNAPDGAGPSARISVFAWAFINKVRMSGLDRLANASRITGSGIALPWRIADQLNLASGEVVEDLALAFELVRNNDLPILAHDARVVSDLPSSEEERIRQSARWEHGGRALARKVVWENFKHAVAKGNLALAMLTFDVAIPPLMRLIAFVFFGGFFALIAFLITGASGALILAGISLAMIAVSVLSGWAGHCRELLKIDDVLNAGSFIKTKNKVYSGEARQSANVWTPTRDHGSKTGRE